MKICLVAHTVPSTGESGVSHGISKVIYNLGKEYIKMGNETTLYARRGKFKDKWVKPLDAPRFSWMPYPFVITPQLLGVKADVYHADYVSTGVPLVLGNKRPAVVSLHGVEPLTYKEEGSTKDKIGNAWFKFILSISKHANAMILASEYARKQAINVGLDDNKVFAVHNGIDTKEYKPLKRKENKTLRIGYLGGLDGRKNVELLVESFKQIDGAELHVGGTGKNLEKFRAMGMENAYFHGFVPDAVKFLNSLDVFVYPTLEEGFGLPPLEAMACGVPVIAANTCSMPEVVGKDGILVRPKADAMTKTIKKVLASKSLRNKMKKKGLAKAKTFTWRACAENTLNVYKAVGA